MANGLHGECAIWRVGYYITGRVGYRPSGLQAEWATRRVGYYISITGRVGYRPSGLHGDSVYPILHAQRRVLNQLFAQRADRTLCTRPAVSVCCVRLLSVLLSVCCPSAGGAGCSLGESRWRQCHEEGDVVPVLLLV